MPTLLDTLRTPGGRGTGRGGDRALPRHLPGRAGRRRQVAPRARHRRQRHPRGRLHAGGGVLPPRAGSHPRRRRRAGRPRDHLRRGRRRPGAVRHPGPPGRAGGRPDQRAARAPAHGCAGRTEAGPSRRRHRRLRTRLRAGARRPRGRRGPGSPVHQARALGRSGAADREGAGAPPPRGDVAGAAVPSGRDHGPAPAPIPRRRWSSCGWSCAAIPITRAPSPCWKACWTTAPSTASRPSCWSRSTPDARTGRP